MGWVNVNVLYSGLSNIRLPFLMMVELVSCYAGANAEGERGLLSVQRRRCRRCWCCLVCPFSLSSVELVQGFSATSLPSSFASSSNMYAIRYPTGIHKLW